MSYKIFKSVLLFVALSGIVLLNSCSKKGDTPGSPTLYTVAFNTNGGTPTPTEQKVEAGKTATLPTPPTKTYYAFDGWYEDTALTKAFDFTKTITANITLYAKWTTVFYTVSFNVNDAAATVIVQNISGGSRATEPTAIPKAGDVFGGWYEDVALTKAFDFTKPITANIALYAKWQKYQLASIADNNFRTALQSIVPHAFQGDMLITNHADVLACKEISVEDASITSLDGIQYFKSLTTLYCDRNAISTLDISNNTALINLFCFDNPLTSLNLSQNTALEILDCNRIDLGTLDLSKNIALKKLTCYSCNLNSLSLSANTTLNYLDISYNNLKSIDLSNNKNLSTLYISSNQLPSLNLINNPSITDLSCDDNLLSSLDVSKNTALRVLKCNVNQITSLDLSKNTTLMILDCSSNNLTTLDARGMQYNASNYVFKFTNNPSLTTLLVRTSIQDQNEVKDAKTANTSLIISTYDNPDASGNYPVVCHDYDPNLDICVKR